MESLKLTIEPIPSRSALASLANLLPGPQWDRIRRRVYKRAGYRCQICGRDARLHCHEVWHYNVRTGWQWLMGFRALCEDCHGVKHLLSVVNREAFLRLARHFMTVNRADREDFLRHLQLAREKRSVLNRHEWKIGFGDFAFRVPVLRNTEQRRRFVELERPCYRL